LKHIPIIPKLSLAISNPEENDEYNEQHIEHADKTLNENTNESNGKITLTYTREIQQIIIKLENNEAQVTNLS